MVSEIANGVRKDETVASADHHDYAVHRVIPPTTRVCLVHSVELRTTRLDLESVSLNQPGEYVEFAYLLLMRVARNMVLVLQILNEIPPP